MNRPTWDEYWMQIAEYAATRSTCLRRQIGAVIVKNNQIISMGYNGAPSGLEHCDKLGCLREQNNIPSGERTEQCRAIHAEQNAIIQAARHGVSIDGATMYVTCSPCNTCSKILINSGIKEIVYLVHYPDKMADKVLEESKIKIKKYEKKEGIDCE